MTVRIPIVCLIILAPLAIAARAAAAPAGCDLAFLEGRSNSDPTIDGVLSAGEWDDAIVQDSGSATCLDDLNDGASLSSLVPVPIKILTKRQPASRYQGGAFYLAFDVTDLTIPGMVTGSPAPIGERLILQFNPDNSNDATLQGDETRLELTNMRGSPGANAVAWLAADATSHEWVASGVTATESTTEPARWELSNGVMVAVKNRASGTPGYIVEIKVPFAAIGYAHTPFDSVLPDFGVAAAVLDDLKIYTELVPGEGNVWALTGSGFPQTPTLDVTMSQDPLSAVDQSAWRAPRNWARGVLMNAGDSVWISHNPNYWTSEDVHVGFCNATDFDTTTPGSAQWYRYFGSGTPCAARLWGKMHRNGGVGDVQKRLLFLWAEHGANPQNWTFAYLTPPQNLSPNSAVVPPGKDWSGMPAGKPEHPCLRVFILPGALLSGFDEDFFKQIGTPPGPNMNLLTQFQNAYSMADMHSAQMNIERIGAAPTCPTCVPCSAPGCVAAPPATLFAGLWSVSAALAQASTPDAAQTGLTDPKADLAVVDFAAVGVNATAPSTPKNYRIVEPLGGVRKIIDGAYLREKGVVVTGFNVSNSADAPRMIYVNRRDVFLPPDLQHASIETNFHPHVFQPGETIRVVAKPSVDGRPSRGCGCAIEPDRRGDGGPWLWTTLLAAMALRWARRRRW